MVDLADRVHRRRAGHPRPAPACRGRSASSAPARSTGSPPPRPATGIESAAAGDDELDEYLHLFLANRGVLITPFHNMALMCPDTTADDVDLHTRLFAEAVAALVAGSTAR